MFLRKIVLFAIISIVEISACPGGVRDPVVPPSKTKSGEQRLIKISEDRPPEWLDSDQIEHLIQMHANFVDVTNHTFPDLAITRSNEKPSGTIRIN